MYSELETRARLFATAAHEAIGQVRKYTGEPYIMHPAAVAELVRGVPHTEEMLAAAWLHDVVEDTRVSLNTIDLEFGPRVGAMVALLTDPAKESGINRAARKAAVRDTLSRAHANVQTIKLADMIDNTKSIVERDPKFAKLYMEEKVALVNAMQDADPSLRILAAAQIQHYLDNKALVTRA